MSGYVDDHERDIDNIFHSKTSIEMIEKIVNVLFAMNENLTNLSQHIDDMQTEIDDVKDSIDHME